MMLEKDVTYLLSLPAISFITGMFGVAISRVRDVDSLSIINFHQGGVKAPGAAVKAFIQDEGTPVDELNICCQAMTMDTENEITTVSMMFGK